MAGYTKWSSFPSTTSTTSGDTVVGLHSGVNEQFLVSATPSASGIALWDANSNISASNVLEGYATTATAAGTTTLTVGSKYQQYFTGSTTQTVVLPVTSTLVLGQSFYIVNNSSGVVTVQSSGSNTIQAMGAGTALLVTCILTSGTTAASWSASVLFNNSNVTGSGALVLANTPTLVTPALGVATATSIAFSGGSAFNAYLTAQSFTPTFTFATPGDLSVSYAIQTGRYWRASDLYIISYTIRFTPTYTTASGEGRFSGLPITAGANNWVLNVRVSTTAITFTGTQLFATAPSSYLVVNSQGTGLAGTTLSTTNFVSGVQYTIIISGTYGV